MNNRGGLKTKLIFITGIIVLLIIGVGLAGSWQRNSEVNQEIYGLENNITDLKKDNLGLKELVEYFNSDAYIEEKARIDLGLRKPNEKVVVVSQQRERSIIDSNLQANKAKQAQLSNPQKWWQYFFN